MGNHFPPKIRNDESYILRRQLHNLSHPFWSQVNPWAVFGLSVGEVAEVG